MHPTAPCPPAIAEVVAAVAPPRRGTVALKLADRFGRSMGPVEADLYDAALLEMIRTEDVPVRAQVSERLADVASGPVRCVMLLAHAPEEEVAAPVLARSPLIPEPVLVSIAWTRGQGHLAAIAERRDLGQRVSDMVLARGAAPVLRRLAANDAARLSADALARLARLSRGDASLTAALARRAARRLDEATPADPEPLGTPAIETAVDWLADLRTVREPREPDVAKALRDGELARAVVLVAHLARLDVEPVARGFRDGALDAMVLTLRVAGLGWPLAERLLRRFAPSGAPIAVQQAAYLRLTPQAARRAFEALRPGGPPPLARAS